MNKLAPANVNVKLTRQRYIIQEANITVLRALLFPQCQQSKVVMNIRHYVWSLTSIKFVFCSCLLSFCSLFYLDISSNVANEYGRLGYGYPNPTGCSDRLLRGLERVISPWQRVYRNQRIQLGCLNWSRSRKKIEIFNDFRLLTRDTLHWSSNVLQCSFTQGVLFEHSP